ncbi:MAG TPA: ABC transporter permease [Anaerolineales bacterium]|nr:ABC transporter permease [Anaerolineales bacterium]
MRLQMHLGINPIIVKELRARMREARAFITLTGVLVMLGGVSYILYRMAVTAGSYSSMPLSPLIGQSLFVALALLELLMVCAIAPAVTSGAISGEQEKLTYEMLLTTPLHPASILWGKLVSALSYVILLIFAAIPMSSLIFIFGGVALRDMAKALVILVTVTISFGILGLFMSALVRRTSRATVLSLLVVVALMFGTIFAYAAVGVIGQKEPPRWILVPNPISALFSALLPSIPYEGSPLGFIGLMGISLGGNLRNLTGATISMTGIPRPLYHYSLPLYGGISMILYLVSTRLVLPARRWRLGWRDVLTLAGLLLVFGGTVTAAFVATADRYELAVGSTPQAEFFPQPVFVEQAVKVFPGDISSDLPVAPVEVPDQAGLEEQNQAQIYATVIRQAFLQDFLGGNPQGTYFVNIVNWTDDSVGGPEAPGEQSWQISDFLQGEILAALGDLPAQARWIGNPDEVISAGEIVYDTQAFKTAVIILLGNLHLDPQVEDQVSVSLAVLDPSLARIDRTYQLERLDGAWEIVESAE